MAIIGKPNAGKSTLLNALLNEERAIVSEIAGTTRDTIEETLNIDGILFRLIDTAGIRQHTADMIESIGVEKSLEKMKQADVVIYLFDVNTTTASELKKITEDLQLQNIKYILVGNKCEDKTTVSPDLFLPDTIFISAKKEQNLNELKHRLVNKVLNGNINTESTVVTNARHYDALVKLQSALNDVKDGLVNQLPGDLLALDIRQCLHYLGLITGEVTNEDQLDFIFSKFCIGK